MQEFEVVQVIHVARNDNKEADELANKKLGGAVCGSHQDQGAFV